MIDHRSAARTPGWIRCGARIVRRRWSRKNSMLFLRSISVIPSAVRRSNSTERISEPSCSFWPRRCACSLSSSSRSMRATARWKRLTVDHEQIFEVGFEAGLAQGGDQGVEDVGDGASDRSGFAAAVSGRVRPGRGDSHRAGVRRGRDRSGMSYAAVQSRARCVRSSWGASLGRIDRAHRGLHGDERRRAVRACTRSAAKGRNEVEDGGRPAILSRDVKAACRRRKIVGLKPLPGRAVCRPDRPLKKAVDAVLSDNTGKRHDPMRHRTRAPPRLVSPFRLTPAIP